MVGYNFGPPQIDFSPLGRLGETYDRSVKRTRDAEIAAKREAALAGFGQNGDLAALGKTLLQAGDLEGGMSALRLQAANEGTPFQRARAAQEDARQAEADAYRRRQEEENNRRYEEGKTRADRPQRITEDGTDPDTGMPTKREGLLFPDGTVRWRAPGAPDTLTPPGPQSGGPGDANLPAPLSQMAGGPPLTEAGQPEYGYAIPGTGQRFPHGTILPPKGDTATAVQAAPTPTVAPANLPAQAAQAQQGTAIAAPAGQVAVAAAPQGQAPIQRRATRDAPLEPDTAPFVRWPPPNVPGKEWVAAETKRLAELSSGGGKAPTKEQADARAAAGKMEGAEREYRPNEGDTISVGQRVLDNVLPGRSSNFITSEKYQQGVAAKKEWIAGLLRKESGAAVTDTEFEYYNGIYFPEVGQGGVVAEQKARARERALQGVKAGMSPSQIAQLDRVSDAPPPAPGQAGGAPPAAATQPAPQRKTSTGVGWSLW